MVNWNVIANEVYEKSKNVKLSPKENMVDYDVMVFVRLEPTFTFYKNVDILDRDYDKAILICTKSWYNMMRDYIIEHGSDIIHEIQIIKPKSIVAY